MSNNYKSWAYVVLAFVAGLSVSHVMPNKSKAHNQHQWNESAANNRAGWARAMQSRKGKAQDRAEAPKKGRRGRGRGKGEDGPVK